MWVKGVCPSCNEVGMFEFFDLVGTTCECSVCETKLRYPDPVPLESVDG